MENGSGATVDDKSSNNNDGTLDNATWSSTVPSPTGFTSNYSVDFDGTGDYITSSVVPVTGSTNRTTVFWIDGDTGSDDSLIHWGQTDADGGAGEKYLIALESGDEVRIEVNSGYEYYTTNVNDGSWHHVGLILNGTNVTDHVCYVDGIEDSSVASASRTINTTSETNLRVGGEVAGLRDYNGRMDEIGIFSTNLDSTDINDIMDNGLFQAATGRTRRFFLVN